MTETTWPIRPNQQRGSTGTPDELAAVEAKPHVPLDPAFAIAPHVLAAAAEWPCTVDRGTDGVDRLRCSDCSQAVAVLGTSIPHDNPEQHQAGLPGTYQYESEQLRGLVLAHLMQRHGFTREKTGG